ncbi:MAG: methyltransferase domain-containing protein [Deltaproteobacteria bacterium]|nr:methyltransferase domain-containing protein [Deltaproteobacteria bacterium]
MNLNTTMEKVLIQEPYYALQVNNHVFRETVYGIVRRLHFLIKHIEHERQRHQLDVNEIRILDVGCGTGVNITVPLANVGYLVHGLDLDQPSLKRARQLTNNLPNVEFHGTLLNKTKFTQPFQVIICSEVLEHLMEPETLVQQMQDVLVDNGLLLVTVPNGYGYFEIERFFEDRIPRLNPVTDEFQKWFVKKYGHINLKQRHACEWKPEHWQLARTSLASDQTHYQRFTPSLINHVLTSQEFEIVEFRNRTFLAGNILSNLVRDWDNFLAWNGRIADRLPAWLCSGWMIAARRVHI